MVGSGRCLGVYLEGSWWKLFLKHILTWDVARLCCFCFFLHVENFQEIQKCTEVHALFMVGTGMCLGVYLEGFCWKIYHKACQMLIYHMAYHGSCHMLSWLSTVALNWLASLSLEKSVLTKITIKSGKHLCFFWYFAKCFYFCKLFAVVTDFLEYFQFLCQTVPAKLLSFQWPFIASLNWCSLHNNFLLPLMFFLGRQQALLFIN